ncbi:MAG: TonB-dependent receptor [Flavobacteriales bacterium]|nr:TonB-dependent receptor [Flavobacteriales bacterium]
MKLLKHLGLASLLMLLISTSVFSQESYTISGSLEDASNGEGLIGATIVIQELKIGAATNVYGFYSLTALKGEYTLIFSYIGYEPMTKKVTLNKNLKFDLELKLATAELEAVEITEERKDANVQSNQMSMNKIDMKEAKAIPVIFGEQDIIKIITLLPGIKSSEGGSGFFIRGGSADQNLILLDEAPVYNASHLLGFFSVFNSDAIKDLSVYKGQIPAEFGGRASSVLDIKMKDGNSKKFNANGGIGLISSRLTLEAPIVKNKGSIMVSGRRTYLDLFLKASRDKDIRNSTLYFYDLNLKANYKLGAKDRLYLSGYFGRDKFGFGDNFGFDWGNTTATLRWNHLFNDKLFLNSTALFSDYNYKVEIGSSEGKEDGLSITSAIQDVSLKEDFSYYLNSKNTVKFGIMGAYHTFLPGEIKPEKDAGINRIELENKYAFEGAAYISNDMKLSELWSLKAGLRYSYFAQVGPGNIFSYDEDGEVSETKKYDDLELVQDYGGLEPRLGATYLLSETSSLKASYGRNRQYLHLISNSSTGTPIDLWIPSSNNVKPQIADQYATGYYRNFKNNEYESSVEVYYKDMQNQIDYKTGADLVFNDNVESQLLLGKGYSYGAEFYFKKNVGRLTGWLSYTWSKTERKFDRIDAGEAYSANWDRTHDLTVVGIYKLNEKWNLSGTFVYRTGNAVTYPVGKYRAEGEIINLYSIRNNDRFPAYHRFDIGATKTLKRTSKFESSLNFSVYNLYGRRNAFAIDFQEAKNNPQQTEAVRIALFSILPSITYNFKFK